MTIQIREDLSKIRKLYKRVSDYKIKYRLLIILNFKMGKSGPEIAHLMQIGKDQVYYWLKRFEKEGIKGLEDRYRSGRPTKIDYQKLNSALEQSPRAFNINQDKWTINGIYKYLVNYQDINISRQYLYEVVKKLDVDIIQTKSTKKFPDLRTKSGKMISSLHLEVMHDVSLKLDAPIHKIITESGIKPILKLKHSDQYSTVLQGKTENGLLTIRYEEYSD